VKAKQVERMPETKKGYPGIATKIALHSPKEDMSRLPDVKM
jgi:hypothetical protein